MKKIILSLIMCLTFVCLLSSCSFKSLIFGLSMEEAKEKLEGAGYTVTVMDGEAYVESDKNPFPALSGSDLKYYLYAEKGEDLIHMYFFYFGDDADREYSFMSMKGLKSGLSNNVIYFGTKQAVKDSGI